MKSRILAVSVVAALGASAYTLAGTNSSPAADHARGLLDSHRAEIASADGDGFTAGAVLVDANGTEHVRFTRSYLGMPVIGGDFVMHSRNGQLQSVSKSLNATARPSIAARLSANDAIVEAGARFGTGFEGTPTARKVIYARGSRPVLAWEVVMDGLRTDQTPVSMHYIVDANSAKLLDQWDTIETAAANGTGNSLYSGQVALATNSISGGYELRDTTRGGTYTTDFNNGSTSKPGTGTIFTDADNTWGTGTSASRQSAGVDAHYGVAKTWDYYQTLGRNGIANDGKGAYNRVHVGRNYVNAFWSDSCFCMSYGDGDGVTYGPLVNLDVAGHEMSHGVTSRSANLTYSGESGGLNESNSDIFGTMVEFYANNANDPGDYEIGEELYLNNPGYTKAFRYMYHPSLEGAGRSVDCWYSGVGSLDVHYSSGPSNHYFYLLAEGSAPKTWPNGTYGSPTCNGSTVTGIGRDAAAKIQYRALTVYMTSNTNYAGARVASLKAATDLFGAGSAQYNAVAAAWSAVSVN
ncbi:M4 family metallopeptidase [Cognatilysobacter lacus]|uniref:Neutral metalloproteinase n=1 Tax=Cognatilysobacter lacus TaxID=1643323 RepID=A0A5D8Z841_9GAMM|nr:M4 family metallopeptidase [Lysobacter lacus]